MRLATVLVSRVFTTGISRNKEIHLKVLIEDDSKIFGPSSIGFLPPQLTRLRPISRVSRKTLCAVTTPAATHIGEEVLLDRNHAGSSKARSAQVLRNSPRAMPLSGYEPVRTELTCKESVLLCFL